MSKLTGKAVKALGIFCLVVLISGVNKPHFSPFTTKVYFDNLSSVCKGDGRIVTVDSEQQRMLVADENGKLIRIQDMSLSGAPMDRITDVSISNDTIHAIGCKLFNKGNYLSSEMICAYSLNGQYLGEEYRLEYSTDDFVTRPQVTSATTDSDKSDLVADHFDYGPGLMIFNILFWLSFVIALILLIYFILKYLISHSGGKNRSLGLALLAILISVGFYSYNAREQMAKQYEQNIITQTKLLSYVFSDLFTDWNSEAWNENPEGYFRDSANRALYDKALEVVQNHCNAHGTDYSIFSKILLVTKDKDIYSFVDSRNFQQAGVLIGNMSEVDSGPYTESPGLKQHEINEAKVLYNWGWFNDAQGNPIGIILTGCNRANMEKSQMDIAGRMLVIIAAVFIILFIGLSVCKDYTSDFKRFKSRGKGQRREKQVDMCGLLMFICTLAAFMDNVIVVFIVQNMCTGLSEAAQAARIAIPMTVMGIGTFVGSLCFSKLRMLAGDRNLTVISCTVAMISMVMAIIAIRISSLELYSVAKFIMGTTLYGIMFSMCNIMPMMADSDQAVSKAVDHNKNAMLAATIIAVSLSGFISEYLSYSTIYIVTAVITLVLAVLSFLIFDNIRPEKQPAGNNRPAKSGWSLFLKGPAVTFVFLIALPMLVASGYRSFLFPLYAANCGMSVLLLSNMQVFTKAFCYMFNGEISSLAGKTGKTRLLFYTIMAIGISLFLFIFSPNIYWAVIVLFIIEVAQRIFNSGSVMYIREQARDYKYDAANAVSEYRAVENGVYIFQSPIISAFMAWGNNLACILLGSIITTFAGLFALFNIKKFKSES